MSNAVWAYQSPPGWMLMNGKGSFMDLNTKAYESFTVTQGRYMYTFKSGFTSLEVL